MSYEFEVHEVIPKTAHDVFQAITQPEHLSKYFLEEASGALAAGQSVTWKFGPYDQETLHVLELTPNQRIELEWQAREVGYSTHVLIRLEAKGEQTKVLIRENGWKNNEESAGFALLHCGAWQQFLCYLKAYLQYGVSLKSSAV